MKRVTLELGGKSASIVFADADLDRAAAALPKAVFGNTGQDCCARSRILVQKGVFDRFLAQFVAATTDIVVGDPEATDADMGPPGVGRPPRPRDVLPRRHRRGRPSRSGPRWSRLLVSTGGARTRPTRCARSSEEVFGPVACVITFRDEADAVRLANASAYGLSGSVWTRDGAKALRVARAVESGTLSVNSNTSLRSRSGVMAALANYTEVKNVFIDTNG